MPFTSAIAQFFSLRAYETATCKRQNMRRRREAHRRLVQELVQDEQRAAEFRHRPARLPAVVHERDALRVETCEDGGRNSHRVQDE